MKPLLWTQVYLLVMIPLFLSWTTGKGHAQMPALPFLRGWEKTLSGETMAYHSWHPWAKNALLVRSTDGQQTIEWITEPIPQEYTGDRVRFDWIAGHSSRTSSADRRFDLSINGEPWFTFTTQAGGKIRSWSITGKENSELSFEAKWTDGYGDLFGTMSLSVPARRFEPGEPLRLKVGGQKAGSPDWYMTFEYAKAESIAMESRPALVRRDGNTFQVIDVVVDHVLPEGKALVQTDDGPIRKFALKEGVNTLEFPVEPVSKERTTIVRVRVPGFKEQTETVSLTPVRPITFFLLPHSHNDIGYSDTQPDVEKKQIKNIRDALTLIRKTADHPDGARFKWNVEILWAVDRFLSQASVEETAEFIKAVKSGDIGLEALYTGPLTGISRPEELFALTDFAHQLEKRFEKKIRTAMITDIPGLVWGLVPALAQSGVRYLSSGPNFIPSIPDGGDRVGWSNRAWADRPFWWVSPSGQEKILFWMAGKGYSWFHTWISGKAGPQTRALLLDYVRELERMPYPYDLVLVRYTIGGDNGPPDPTLPDFVKSWNEQYISPRLVIATSETAFDELEKQYGDRLPSYSGDFTPYWEDGAMSSAFETILAKAATERLLQAETVWALKKLTRTDSAAFDSAWKSVLLFDEHTWGAHSSVNDPDSPFSRIQWEIKRSFAVDADRLSRRLLEGGFSDLRHSGSDLVFEVFNTLSWPRTDIVVVWAGQSRNCHRVVDGSGRPVPSQRLSGGELAFLAENIPGFGSRKYILKPGPPATAPGSEVSVSEKGLSNEFLDIGLDVRKGTITRLWSKSSGQELADTTTWGGINAYWYVPGTDPSEARTNGPVRIEIVDRGPLVASLSIRSEAPGCRSMVRSLRLFGGLDRLDIVDTVDKQKIREKESVHWAFPFAVPGGMVRLDAGWGVVRPESDQLAGSCKDFFSSGRWADVSNQTIGVTWAVPDNPLVEIGRITDESPKIGGRRTWEKSAALSSTLFSYAMNNYWHTNYKADQEGPVTFRFSIRAHGLFRSIQAFRFGLERCRPLLVRVSDLSEPASPSPMTMEPGNIMIPVLKPSRDRKAWIARIFNAGEAPEDVRIRFSSPAMMWESGPEEEKHLPMEETFCMPPYGLKTVRIEFTE